MSSYPLIIQGGMGIAVSNYNLAKAVSMAGQEEEKPLVTMRDDYKSVVTRPYGYTAQEVINEIIGS